MTPAKVRWGLLFITVGVMLLLCNVGQLDWDYWYELLVWWPLLLIAIGLEKMFLRTKLEVISYLAPVLLIAGMVYVAVETGSDRYVGGFFSSSSWSEEADPSIEMIDAVIEHGNTDLYVNRDRYDLASARFGRFSRKPHIEFSKSDGVAGLDIKRRRGGLTGAVVISGSRFDRNWNMSFSDEIPLKLKCSGYSADLNLNMESIPLRELTIEDDEGDIYLKIGDKIPQVKIDINGYDADLRLRVPEECGIKVFGNKYAAYLKAVGLVEDGNDYVTEHFDSSAVRLSLTLDDDLRHFSIDLH
jgi:hypothetical protein